MSEQDEQQSPDEQQSTDAVEETEPGADLAQDGPVDGEQGAPSTEGDGPARDGEDPDEEERRREEFAREHDPADHDIAAGEEFRQPGDWTADDGDGPQHLTTDQSMVAAGASGSTTAATDEGAEDEGAADVSQGEGDGDAADAGQIRDGGHGWGSAAPLEGGGTPPGHPVKAWHDTMTYVLPDEEGYGADPHECFVDGETAQRAGFRHAHG